MHIAIVSCTRKHAHELGPNLLSLTTHAPHAHVHVFTDSPGMAALTGCADSLRARLASLELHTIDELSSGGASTMLDYDAKLARSAPRLQPTKFACASAKLMLQGAPPLRAVPYVLALDADTVTNEALSPLWRAGTAELGARADALWGLVPEHEAAERPLTFGKEMRDVLPRVSNESTYFNTGVLLIATARLRARNLTHPSQLLAQLTHAARNGREAYNE
jgi:hypothetical protein